MPHKRNPVLSENLTGLARIVRAAAGAGAGERGAVARAGHQPLVSVERVIGPDATVALDFALVRLAGMMEQLVVYPERMRANLESLGGVVHCGEVLLALTRAGILREDAYRIVQRNAMATWERLGTPEGAGSARTWWRTRRWRGRVAAEVLDAAMDPAMHLRAVDHVVRPGVWLSRLWARGPAASFSLSRLAGEGRGEGGLRSGAIAGVRGTPPPAPSPARGGGGEGLAS